MEFYTKQEVDALLAQTREECRKVAAEIDAASMKAHTEFWTGLSVIAAVSVVALSGVAAVLFVRYCLQIS